MSFYFEISYFLFWVDNFSINFIYNFFSYYFLIFISYAALVLAKNFFYLLYSLISLLILLEDFNGYTFEDENPLVDVYFNLSYEEIL
jgi:hypothetical protein